MNTSKRLRIAIGYGLVTGMAAFLGRYYPRAEDIYSLLIWVPLFYPLFLLVQGIKNAVARVSQPRRTNRSLDFTNRG